MLTELKEQYEAAVKRARSLKTKRAQSKAYDKARMIRQDIFEALCELRAGYAPFSLKGVVSYFHPGDENVLIKTSDGSVWITPTSDEVSKSWYASTCCVSYTEGQTVIIEFEVDIDHDRYCLIRIPRRVRGGSLDEAQYTKLCQQPNLAFFKYPTGMSGLFSSKAVQS